MPLATKKFPRVARLEDWSWNGHSFVGKVFSHERVPDGTPYLGIATYVNWPEGYFLVGELKLTLGKTKNETEFQKWKETGLVWEN